MASIGKIARRTFLFGSVAIAGGVALGAWYVSRPAPNPLKPQAGDTTLNPFVMITQEEGVVLVAPRAEMGQGVRTTWAALLAEELDMAWEDVKVIHGPAAAAYYNTTLMAGVIPNRGYDRSAFQESLGDALSHIGKVFELQVTGGSTSMRDGYERMRVAGASAREMLKGAAAEKLGVNISLLKTENGTVIAPDGTALPYSDLAERAADLPPQEIVLRDRSEWKLLGTPLPRVDMVPKSTGTAEFGIDVRRPGMKFASLKINPHLGAGMNGFDATEARKMPGVIDVVDLGRGIAVVADNTWLAMQAAEAVEIDWAAAEHPADMAGIMDRIADAFATEPNSTMRDDGDVDVLPDGATVVEAEYTVPFLSHATMEPMNATALIDGKGLTLWCGNQIPTIIRDRCAETAGLDSDRVEVHTTYMGGGFGRRGEIDFSQYATMVAMALPGTPVQVTWSREEDLTHDFYRPGAIARMRGAVNSGQASVLDAQIAVPSCAQQALGRWMGSSLGGPDQVAVEGLHNAPYAIPSFRTRGYLADLTLPIGFWRSVGNSHNGFFMESFIDEMAHAAAADPLAFRLEMAAREWEPGAAVLSAVKEMSGWTGTTPEGVGRGVAFCYSFETPVATVIEVTDEDGAIRLNRAWTACDVGVALDPSIIEAQMIGGLIYGLSAAMNEEITFTDGAVDQQNFPDYEPLRHHMAPRIEVQILEGKSEVTGVGEPGTPPAAPALANAIFDLTGQRIRTLPLRKSVDFWI